MTKRSLAKEVLIWALTLFVALVALRSGVMKMPGVAGVQFWIRDFQRWGYPGWFRVAVGIAEIISVALMLIPRLASYGAAIFGIVMLGAIFTHATHSESSRLPFNFILLIICIALFFLRKPKLVKNVSSD